MESLHYPSILEWQQQQVYNVGSDSSADKDKVAREKKKRKITDADDHKSISDNANVERDDDQQAKKQREVPEEEEKKKLDYIHVRARRGQATDSHSLAERVRRERISERMKYLQDLVPGCNKITGKAGMLDEIINYVQSLQKQVEFLSMKLATVSPRPDLNIESFFNKEINMGGDSAISTFGMSSNLIDPSYDQSNFLQHVANFCGYHVAMNPTPELATRTNVSTSMTSSPETFSDSCFSVPRPSSSCLDNEMHSLYGVEFHQGRSPTFPFHSMQGNLLPNNPKMEM